MKNTLHRSQYIDMLKWLLVTKFAYAAIVQHKYTVKYALKTNSPLKK